MQPDFSGAFMDGLYWAGEIVLFTTGAGIVLGLWLFVGAMLFGHAINWLIEATGSK